MTRWALVVGAKGPRKGALLAEIVAELARRGVRVGGVLQEPVEVREGRAGHRARRVGTSEGVVLGARGAPPPESHAEDTFEFCSYHFDRAAFARARAWIAAAAREADVVVVDEASKLEVASEGHYEALRDALAAGALVLLGARGDQLFALVEKLGLGDALATLDAAETDAALAPFVKDLVDSVARARAGAPA